MKNHNVFSRDHLTMSISCCVSAAGSEISKKLKLTYKTSTSKLVSSFRAASTAYQQVREFRGHRDGVWEVNTSKSDSQVIGTASAGNVKHVNLFHVQVALLSNLLFFLHIYDGST